MEMKVEVRKRETLDGWLAVYSEDGVERYAVKSEQSPEHALFKLGGDLGDQADTSTLYRLFNQIDVAAIPDEIREEQR